MIYYNSPPQQIQTIKFVNGRQGAEQCMLPWNSKAILMDMNDDIFYLKETDMNGISSMTAFGFQRLDQPPQNNYITRAEFEEWRKKYESTFSAKQSGSSDFHEANNEFRSTEQLKP